MTLPDVTAGADSVSFSTGTTRSYSTTTTETWGRSATASVSAGFTAFGVNITASVSGTLSKTMAESSASSFSQTTTETRTTKFTEIGVGWQWQFDITDDCGTSTTLSPGFPIVTPSSDKPPCCLPGQFLVDESNNKRDDFNCIAGAVNLCTGDNTACKLWDKDATTGCARRARQTTSSSRGRRALAERGSSAKPEQHTPTTVLARVRLDTLDEYEY